MRVSSLVRGGSVFEIRKLHEEYGEIVRIGPNELSFATPKALPDIFSYRVGHKPFLKNQIFVSPPPGQGHSLITTPSPEDHARMRKLLAFSFTEKALKSQESIIQTYVQITVDRLLEIIGDQEKKPGQGTVVDMVD
ncbi:MAG: hypothetical protein Q9174_005136, partial [Haloplaca sp. 1 TL-2023]